MFTEREKEELSDLLERAVTSVDTLSIDGLHGLLFGLAVSPELPMPADWLPLIFGREMTVFGDKKQADRHLVSLLSIYNRIVRENLEGTLALPFDIEKITGRDIPRIRQWCIGLTRVMSIVPERWGITEQGPDPETMTEAEYELAASIGVVTGVAYPDDAPEIFTPDDSGPEEFTNSSERQGKVLFFLPMAVDTIRLHGNKLRGTELKNFASSASPGAGSIGRNDPCPCNSGKKYKKCCEA